MVDFPQKQFQTILIVDFPFLYFNNFHFIVDFPCSQENQLKNQNVNRTLQNVKFKMSEYSNMTFIAFLCDNFKKNLNFSGSQGKGVCPPIPPPQINIYFADMMIMMMGPTEDRHVLFHSTLILFELRMCNVSLLDTARASCAETNSYFACLSLCALKGVLNL